MRNQSSGGYANQPDPRLQRRTTLFAFAFFFIGGAATIEHVVEQFFGSGVSKIVVLCLIPVLWYLVRWARANVVRTLRVNNLLIVTTLVGLAASVGRVSARDDRPTREVDPPAATAPTRPELAPPSPAPDNAIRIVSWNLNSGVVPGGNQRQLDFITRLLGSGPEVDAYVFTEVEPGWMQALDRAADAGGTPYGIFWTRSGNNQRIAILFREDRFQRVHAAEMSGVQASPNHRNPLSVTLYDRRSQRRFELIGAHLARGNSYLRTAETGAIAGLLNRSTDPVIVIGDMNMDCPPGRSPTACDPAPFQNLVGPGGLHWVRPAAETGTTCDTRYNDMLDLAFLGRGAERWAADLHINTEALWCTNMAAGAHYPIVLEVRPR